MTSTPDATMTAKDLANNTLNAISAYQAKYPDQPMPRELHLAQHALRRIKGEATDFRVEDLRDLYHRMLAAQYQRYGTYDKTQHQWTLHYIMEYLLYGKLPQED